MRDHLASLKRWEKKEKKYLEMRARVARDIYVGYMILHNSSDHHFGELKYGLHQDYLTGNNHFPDNAEDALRLLVISHRKRARTIIPGDNEAAATSANNTANAPAVSLYQTDNTVMGTDGKSFPKVECWQCGAMGHYKDHCPKMIQLLQTVESSSMTQDGDEGNFGLSYFQAGRQKSVSKSEKN